MTRPRLYLPHGMQAGECYPLEDKDRKYLRSVLRLAEGDPVLVFNGSGREGEGIIQQLDDTGTSIKILHAWSVPSDNNMAITLAQSLPKSDKMDFILQKATELGIRRIIPFYSQRTIPRLDDGRASVRRERWRKIVLEAARQCRSAHIPEVSPILPFREMLKQASADDLKMILWEEETATDIKGLLKRQDRGKEKACFLVVGPEGGFTDDEIVTAKERQFMATSLGRHVLRTETASLAVITIIQYEKSEFFSLAGVKTA